jgi:hypothetical protein
MNIIATQLGEDNESVVATPASHALAAEGNLACLGSNLVSLHGLHSDMLQAAPGNVRRIYADDY